MVHPCILTHADNSMSGLSGNILVFVFWNNKHFWSSSGNEIFQAFGLGKESWTLFIFAPSEAHPSYRRINWKINDCRHTKKHHIFLIKKSALSILAAAASKERIIETLSINMLNQKKYSKMVTCFDIIKHYFFLYSCSMKSLLWRLIFQIICLLLWLTGIVNPLNYVAKQKKKTNTTQFIYNSKDQKHFLEVVLRTWPSKLKAYKEQ